MRVEQRVWWCGEGWGRGRVGGGWGEGRSGAEEGLGEGGVREGVGQRKAWGRVG